MQRQMEIENVQVGKVKEHIKHMASTDSTGKGRRGNHYQRQTLLLVKTLLSSKDGSKRTILSLNFPLKSS